jgi:predicted kinase
MREVILTVGTRAAGKSTFCKGVTEFDPSITMVSRDAILMSMFGKTSLDSYSGGHEYAAERMWEAVQKQLEPRDARMILDTWNGDGRSRRWIIQKLRKLGANRVVAWYFITPVEVVEQWFWQKPDIAKFGEMGTTTGVERTYYFEDAPRRDHEMYHSRATDIDQDGFDRITRINPLFAKPRDLFPFQTSFSF